MNKPVSKHLRAGFLAAALISMPSSILSADEFVNNGDFSDNAADFSTYPGYAGGSNAAAIEYFSSTMASGSNFGINGPGTTNSGAPFQPSDYYSASNSNLPNDAADPLQFAFIQVNGASQPASGSYLSQTINLQSNTTYTLSFDAAERRVGFGNDGVTGDVSILNAGAVGGVVLDYDLTSIPNGDFKYYTETFTTGTLLGATTLRLTNTSDTAGDHTIDFADVSVTPEPSTYALLGLGVGALLVMRRRLASR